MRTGGQELIRQVPYELAAHIEDLQRHPLRVERLAQAIPDEEDLSQPGVQVAELVTDSGGSEIQPCCRSRILWFRVIEEQAGQEHLPRMQDSRNPEVAADVGAVVHLPIRG